MLRRALSRLSYWWVRVMISRRYGETMGRWLVIYIFIFLLIQVFRTWCSGDLGGMR
jgi:hypothetical protein